MPELYRRTGVHSFLEGVIEGNSDRRNAALLGMCFYFATININLNTIVTIITLIVFICHSHSHHCSRSP